MDCSGLMANRLLTGTRCNLSCAPKVFVGSQFGPGHNSKCWGWPFRSEMGLRYLRGCFHQSTVIGGLFSPHPPTFWRLASNLTGQKDVFFGCASYRGTPSQEQFARHHLWRTCSRVDVVMATSLDDQGGGGGINKFPEHRSVDGYLPWWPCRTSM